MMKHYLISLVILIFSSCTSFEHLSKSTEIGKDETSVTVSNSKLSLLTRTFGDVKFALNNKQFKELKNSKPAFKNILFYGITKEPDYEYYLLLNPSNNEFKLDKFDYKDTIINDNRFVVLISKSTPNSDKEFILNNILSLEYTER